jgi:hypothetical protein
MLGLVSEAIWAHSLFLLWESFKLLIEFLIELFMVYMSYDSFVSVVLF